jgi:hypothetical protein
MLKQVLFIAALVLAGAHLAHAGALKEALNCDAGKRCVVTSNGGGDVDLFRRACLEAVASGTHIVIAGFCGSACLSQIATCSVACVQNSAVTVEHPARTELRRNSLPGIPIYTGPETTKRGADARKAYNLAGC